MKILKNAAILVLSSLMLFGCAATKQLANIQIENQMKSRLYGQVTLLEGNQMPMRNNSISKGKAFMTQVYIYNKLNYDQLIAIEGQWCKQVNQTPLQTISTDTLGRFAIELVPGNYTVLVAAYGGYFIPFFNQYNQPSAIDLKEKKAVELNILVNSKANY